jgi:hypothetical protein
MSRNHFVLTMYGDDLMYAIYGDYIWRDNLMYAIYGVIWCLIFISIFT